MNNIPSDKPAKRAAFGSKLGALAATAGSAVGLGNVWRFPTEVGEHGGGAFLLIYLLAIVLTGMPVMLCEFVIGHRARRSVKLAIDHLSRGRRWGVFGRLFILTSVLCLGFYNVVAGWTLGYFVQGAAGKLGQELDHTALFAHFSAHTWWPLLCALAFVGLTHFVVRMGVEKGIERFSRVMMPTLLLLIGAMIVCSLGMPGMREGMNFLLRPDFSKVTGSVVLAAMGQAFFSLSLGLGCHITYASYFSPTTNLSKSAYGVAAMDTMVAVMCGFFIFPAVFSVPGIEPASGPGLAFITLPNVFRLAFADIPFLGYVFTLMFYLLLILAALTSTICLHETVTSHLSDELGLPRRRSAILVTCVTAVLVTLCTWSFGPLNNVRLAGLTFFDLFDHATANLFMPIGGIFVCLFVGWQMRRSDVREELSHNGRINERLFAVFMFLIRYIVPGGIAAILINSFL